MATSSTAARSAARSTARAAKRRKVARPPQPRTPEDFFDPEGYNLLKTLLIANARRWQRDGLPPIFIYQANSEPRCDTLALMPCSRTTIRLLRLKTLSELLGMDLERALRLLTLTWNDQRQTVEGRHDVEAWQQALSGCLWRIGQLYREFTRRKGAAAARQALQDAMQALHRPDLERVHRLLSSFSIDETPPIHVLSALLHSDEPVPIKEEQPA